MGVSQQEVRETVATCDSCGAAYTARLESDGSVQIVGASKCRSCGGETFTELTIETDYP